MNMSLLARIDSECNRYGLFVRDLDIEDFAVVFTDSGDRLIGVVNIDKIDPDKIDVTVASWALKGAFGEGRHYDEWE